MKQSSTDMNPLLAERITVVKGQHGTGPVGGEEGGAIHSPVVLYWMKVRPSARPVQLQQAVPHVSPETRWKPPHSGLSLVMPQQTALRAHHNPALDIARFEAGRRGCPLVVAAPLLFDYPYASARRIQVRWEPVALAQASAEPRLPSPARPLHTWRILAAPVRFSGRM